MFILRSLFSKFRYSEKAVSLGRWNLDYCSVILNKKVTMTNEDHCGVCESTVIREKSEDSEENEFLKFMVSEQS